MTNEYYVYLYLREDATPYYVGKGKDNRAFQKHGKRLKLPSDKSRIVFYAENLTEDEAFALEKELIAKYGRKDNGTGILRNLTDGGDGTSGAIFSDESRAKMSQNNAMKNNPEVRAKVSAKAKVRQTARMSIPEVRAKHSEKMKEVANRPEVKAKISQNNGMKRPEVRDAIREYHRKKKEAKQASANTLTKFFSE